MRPSLRFLDRFRSRPKLIALERIDSAAPKTSYRATISARGTQVTVSAESDDPNATHGGVAFGVWRGDAFTWAREEGVSVPSLHRAIEEVGSGAAALPYELDWD